MNYSIPYINGCREMRMNRINTIDKRVMRMGEKRPFRDHNAPLYKKNNILKIKESIKLYAGKVYAQSAHQATSREKKMSYGRNKQRLEDKEE